MQVEHRLLTATNATTAAVNVLLSVALIRPLGLLGVALGTLIPVSLSAILVLYPAACRRVGLPVSRALSQAIWPAAWPAIVMIGVLSFGRRLAPPTHLVEVALHLAVGGLVYIGLFLSLAIGAEERRFYWMKLRGLVSGHRRAPAAA